MKRLVHDQLINKTDLAVFKQSDIYSIFGTFLSLFWNTETKLFMNLSFLFQCIIVSSKVTIWEKFILSDFPKYTTQEKIL